MRSAHAAAAPAIFAAIFGIALSGLFWLLGNLSEPELLRSKKAVVIEGLRSHRKRGRRPHLSAAVLPEDPARQACRRAALSLQVTVDKRSGAEHLIGGTARPYVAKPGDVPEHTFACLLDGDKVVAGRVVKPAELQELTAAANEMARS